MSFQKAGNLSSLVDQYVKAYNEIQATITKIPDEKTLKQIRTNYNILNTNGKKIDDKLESGEDPDTEALKEQYNPVAMGFESQKASWEAILKKKEAEYKKIHDEEAHNAAMANLSEEQLQIQQQADDLDYIGRQVDEIKTMQQDLNEITHKVDDKITEDHEKVVNIDNHIEKAKTEMEEGNKDLDHAEKDQKKCNIC